MAESKETAEPIIQSNSSVNVQVKCPVRMNSTFLGHIWGYKKSKFRYFEQFNLIFFKKSVLSEKK